MTSEWQTDIREGYRTKIVKMGNCTIEIHRPILTPDEQRKREKQIIDALRGFRKGVQQ
jgi:hypothetical protein